MRKKWFKQISYFYHMKTQTCKIVKCSLEFELLQFILNILITLWQQLRSAGLNAEQAITSGLVSSIGNRLPQNTRQIFHGIIKR